jgi:hypothetical protein
MATYIILEKNTLFPKVIVDEVFEPGNAFQCKPVPIKPSTPITTIFSCHEPTQDPVVLPMRSTFCFPASTMKYKSITEIRQLKNQWDTFERIENINSIVLNTLANKLPTEASSGTSAPTFYQFTGSDENTAYNQGQLAHTVTYPDVVDFLVPYASKPIPYTSTVLSTMKSKNYDPGIPPGASTFCSNILPTLPRLDNDILLRNKNGLNLYVRVSTQIAQFPKSPYKFSSNNEYITYNEFKRALS